MFSILGLKLRLAGGDMEPLSDKSIRVSDPRFAWVVKRFGKPNADDQLLSEYLSRTLERENWQAETEAINEHISEYVKYALSLKIDEELVDISASIGVGGGDRLEAILQRIGWFGDQQLTLEETGQLLGVTRERARQIEAKLLKKISTRPIWTPILAESVDVVRGLLPISEGSFSNTLRGAGLIESSLSLKNYLKALELFSIENPFDQVERFGQNWLIIKDEVEDLEFLSEIRTLCVKTTSRHGITNLYEIEEELGLDESDPITIETIRDVVDAVSNLKLVDNFWVLPADKESRNTLRNRLRKILSVANPISIEDALLLIEREERPERSLDVSAAHIAALCVYYPEFIVNGSEITTTVSLRVEDELSDSELIALRQIRLDGGISSFGAIERAIVQNGGTRVTTAVTLRYSPVFLKPERATYIVAGTRMEDAMLHANRSDPFAVQNNEENDPEFEALVPDQESPEMESSAEDASTSSVFGEIATSVKQEEIIYTGAIDVDRVNNLRFLGRRWATLVDQQTNRIVGLIRLSRLINKHESGNGHVYPNDPKVLGIEVTWSADAEELGTALDESFVVFCNRIIDCQLDHYLLFRHSFLNWRRRKL